MEQQTVQKSNYSEMMKKIDGIHAEVVSIRKTCRENILVIDDAPYILELFKKSLDPLDYNVILAEDGAIGLSLYHKFHPDLVTLDYLMPVMNGYETLVQIMKLDKNANVLMVTALEHESVISECINAGACGFLTKPLQASDIQSAIPIHLTASGDKILRTLFFLDCRTLENTLNRITNSNKTVRLVDIDVRHKERSIQNKVHYDTIVAVPEIKTAQVFQLPKDCSAYYTVFHGQLNGTIMTTLRNSEIRSIFGEHCDDTAILEFFNIINAKLVSQIVRLTGYRVSDEIVKKFDNNSSSDLGEEVAIIKYHIIHKDKIFQLETQLWTNLSVLNTRSRFA